MSKSEPERVVLCSYGSNIDGRRFRAYIHGSSADSGFGEHRGSADAGGFREVGTAWIDGELRFGGTSRRWSGHGMAYADVPRGESERSSDRLFVVMYDIGWQQFLDVVSQENGGVDVHVDPDQLFSEGQSIVSDKFYDCAVALKVGAHDRCILLTHDGLATFNAPAPDYLDIIVGALGRRLPAPQWRAYLDRALARR